MQDMEFIWGNEGKGVVAVHCVIVGFALKKPERRTIFDYSDNIKSEPTTIPARNINLYLVDAPNVILPSRTDTPPGLPQMKQAQSSAHMGKLDCAKNEHR